MKKIILSLAFFGVLLPARFTFAQSVTQPAPSAADLLAAVNTLQKIDAARQTITGQINLQFAQITSEVQNLTSEPRNTVNEQEAFVAELGAIATKLGELSSANTTVNQIQSAENSIFATLQTQMNALGI